MLYLNLKEHDLEELIAISHVNRAAEEGVTRGKLEEMREGIERDIRNVWKLLGTPAAVRRADCRVIPTAPPKAVAAVTC